MRLHKIRWRLSATEQDMADAAYMLGQLHAAFLIGVDVHDYAIVWYIRWNH